MAKLKLGAIADDKPIKLTVELPAGIHRDLLAYADAFRAIMAAFVVATLLVPLLRQVGPARTPSE